MADFNNLALTTRGAQALLAAQAGTTLKLTKIGMGSGSTTGSITGLTSLVSPEVMMPISEKRIDTDSGFMSIVAKMTNRDITEGFYWRETGLFFEDEAGNDVLFAYACVTNDQYDYVPAYNDIRYVKHVRIANIITDSANIEVEERQGLLYVDTLTFEEYKEYVEEYKEYVEAELGMLKQRPVNNNLLINSNFANPVNQRGKTTIETGTAGYWIDRWEKFENLKVSLNKGYVELTRGAAGEHVTLIQVVEEPLLGKTVTFSVKPYGIDDVVSVTATIPTSYADVSSNKLIGSSAYVNNVGVLIYLRSDGLIHVAIIPRNNYTVRVEWAKLELGDKVTPYVVPLYSDELIRCGVPDDSSEYGYKEYYCKSPVNNNLLINSNFANPVNQRGFTSKAIGASACYSIDRWNVAANISMNVDDGHIALTRGTATSNISLTQTVEDVLLGKTVTFSAKLYDSDTILTTTVLVPKNYSTSSDVEIADSGVIDNARLMIYQRRSDGRVRVQISLNSNSTIKVEWAKLELGNHATPYVPRRYVEEFLVCQRYYQKIYVRDSVIYGMDSYRVFATKDFELPMRVTPTCDVSNCIVQVNGQPQTDFAISTNGVDVCGSRLVCKKDAHGLSATSFVSLTGYILADAEI